MARASCLRLVALTVLLAALASTARPAHAVSWACFKGYHATCYVPAQVSAAEQAMAVRPVNPTSAVIQATHLPLVRVVVEQDAVTHGKGRVIFYSFGVAIAIDRPLPRTSRPSIFVTEFVLPKAATQAGVKYQPGTIPSALASFPHRKLALLVAGHFPRQVLLQITHTVLGQ